MKLLLDVAAGYLLDKNDFYRRKANITLVISVSLWLLTILSVSLIFYFKSLDFWVVVPLLLFAAILTMCIAKNFYAKAYIYNEIYDDLENIRELANREAKKQEQNAVRE